MEKSPGLNDNSISSLQTEQLYARLKYSSFGTFILALTMVFIIAPKSNQTIAWFWLAGVAALSSYRLFLSFKYSRHKDMAISSFNWRLHFNIGVYLAAISWVLPIWLFYPVNHPEYQVLMILCIAGVGGAAVSILSYDKNSVIAFLAIVLIGVEIRLLLVGDIFSYQLATLTFLYFVFIAKGGRDIANSYLELLILRQNSEKYNLTLLSTAEHVARIGYWQWDLQSREIDLSENLARMCDTEERKMDIHSCIKKVHINDKKRVKMAIEDAIHTDKEQTIEYRFRPHKTQDWMIINQVIKNITDSSGKVSLLGTIQDISVIRSAEQKIYDMAYYDDLTGLANRNHFFQHLSEQIKYAKRNQQKLAIFFIDLDDFKQINDTYGHNSGDTYLKVFSKNLSSLIREVDFISRLGGDEFCIVMTNSDDIGASKMIERCLSLSNNKITIANQSISPKMSIGISVYPQNGDNVETLLRAADTAMYAAKNNGKHSYAFYDPQITIEAVARMEFESELQYALYHNEFSLMYQPKVALKNGKIKGVEALIRWNSPRRGFVSPEEFIKVAERIGIINKIGEWVLDEACKQLQDWKLQGLTLDMAVNISPSHFSSLNFASIVKNIKQQYKLSDNELEIEITESVSRDPENHSHICQELHNDKIKIAIDDFGTGYSSLSVLRELEVDTLKVDRAFVKNLPADQSSILMATAIVNMATGLGFDVVAEGAETKEQVDFLRSLGCPYIQGYYYSRPVQADEIPALAMKIYS